MLPYGFYLRAMFYNKKLFQEAGVAEPPKTMDEFVTASEKVAKLPGKYGYCLRGGPGGLNGWVMFGASMAGSNAFFNEDGTSTMNSEGWVKGLTWVVDLYKKGLAPKDSVNWGFNEIVAGFYTGTCAMLIAGSGCADRHRGTHEAGRLRRHDHAQGAGRQDLPDHGHAGWSMMAASQNKDLSWKLIETLEGPEGNVSEWNKRTGALPVHKSARPTPSMRATSSRAGAFAELEDKDAVPTVMPTYLEEFAFFKDSLGHQDQPAGPARRHTRGGNGQSMGRLSDQGAAEVPGQEIARRTANGRSRPARSWARRLRRSRQMPVTRPRRRSEAECKMVFDATAGLRNPPRRVLFHRMARNAEPYLYAAPALILIVTIMLVPLVLGLSYAFRDIKLLNPFSGGFVGLDHFRARSMATTISTGRCATRCGGPAPRSACNSCSD